MKNMRSTKTIITAMAALSVIILVGCPTPMAPNASVGAESGEPHAGSTLQIVVNVPNGSRAQSMDFSIVTLEITASRATYTDVVAQLTFDVPSSSWIGAVEGLANGEWLFTAEALDNSTTPVVLFSGSVLFTVDSAAAGNAVSIDLMEAVGNVRFDITIPVENIIDTIVVTSIRASFTNATWSYSVPFGATTFSVFAVNLPEGDWDFDLDGSQSGSLSFEDTIATVTVTSAATTVVAQTLTQTRVTPVSFSESDAGVFASDFDLVLSTLTPGASILYTTDGVTDPLVAGTVYSGPINVADVTTVQAAATFGALADSPVSIANYAFAFIDVTSLSVYWDHVALLKNDGTLWLWGSDDQNKLGLPGDWTWYDEPGQMPTGQAWPDAWQSVSAGTQHTAAIGTDGTLWTWGYNNYGQLGNGTTTSSDVPIQEAYNATNWTSVAAGSSHTLAVDSLGQLWAWGSRGDYKLGDGIATGQSNIPQQIGTATNWTKVFAGGTYSMAQKSDGSLWSWGDNQYEGKLGIKGYS